MVTRHAATPAPPLAFLVGAPGAAPRVLRALGVEPGQASRDESVEEDWYDTPDRDLLLLGYRLRVRPAPEGRREARLESLVPTDRTERPGARWVAWPLEAGELGALAAGTLREGLRRTLGRRPLRPLRRERGIRRHLETSPRPDLLLAVVHERVEVASGGSPRAFEEVVARLVRGRRATWAAWRRRTLTDLAQEGTGIEVGPRARPLAPLPALPPARVAAARLALHAPLGPAAPAGRALAQALAVASFRWRDAFARARQGSIEGVHDVRTLARRLRALLAVHRGLAPEPARRDLRGLLDTTRRAAGALRDLDVLGETVEAVAPPSVHAQGLAHLRRALTERRRALRRQWRADVTASAIPSVSDRLLDLAVATHEVPSPPVAICAAARLPLTLERALGLWAALPRPAADAPDEALHALRIAAKRVRYATECFAPALGRPAARFLERIRAVHDGLGRIHDAPAVRAGLDALRASLDEADPRAETLALAVSSIEAAVEAGGLAARRGLDRLLEAALGRDALRDLLAHLGKRAGAFASDGAR